MGSEYSINELKNLVEYLGDEEKNWIKLVEDEIKGNTFIIRKSLIDQKNNFKRLAKDAFQNFSASVYIIRNLKDEDQIYLLSTMLEHYISSLKESTKSLIEVRYIIPSDFDILQGLALQFQGEELSKKIKDNIPEILNYEASVINRYDILNGESDLRYRCINGEKIRERCERDFPHLFKSIALMYENRKVVRKGELEEAWPRIAYYLADSQSTNPIIPKVLSHDEKYQPFILLSNSPAYGKKKLTLSPLSPEIKKKIEEELTTKENKNLGMCDITILNKKVNVQRFLNYSLDILSLLLRGKTDIPKAREYLENLSECLRESPTLEEKFSKIREKLLAEIYAY
jgi:hypothetical protein